MTLAQSFKNYLVLKGYHPSTTRNYVCDLNYFLAWFELKLKSKNLPCFGVEEKTLAFFTPEIASQYQSFLLKNDLPSSTVNRRLSGLRIFTRFAISQKWLKINPLQNFQNTSKNMPKDETVLSKFKNFLETEKTSGERRISANTIKSYLSDINSFLKWLELAT